MSKVIHVMRDGTKRESVEGLTVKINEAQPVYKLIDQINKGDKNNGNHV